MTPSRGSTPELPPVVSSMRRPMVFSRRVQHSSSVATQLMAPLSVPSHSAFWSSADLSEG